MPSMSLEGSQIQFRKLASKAMLAAAFGLFFYGAQAGVTKQGQKIKPEISSEFFESKIRPTIETKCIGCHGPKQQLGDIRLDQPISAEIAKLVAEAISYKTDVKMPPSGKLPSDQLMAMTSWANAGAPWPKSPTTQPKKDGKFWSFVPPKTPSLPDVKLKSWGQNPIDRFILAKLEEKGLKPAPVADRRTLIRRATFDLTGLPPTPAEINDFLADKSSNSFEKVIDRLLASPAYGERWGRHWLDVARYADSNGLDENLVYLQAWRYRDYVIQALNKDKPIDRFIQEQIAGDLLPDGGDEGIVATGYLALGAKMLAEDDPKKQELDIIDEQVDTTSKTFLGLTVGCARCHDHKFDPISAKDYYAMAGIFKSTKTMLHFRVVADWNERALGSKADKEKLASIEKVVETYRNEVNKKRSAASDVLTKELTKQLPEYTAAAKEYLDIERRNAQLKAVISTPNGAIPTTSILREAEDFNVGNVNKDKAGFGAGIGVLVNRGEYPNHVEYKVDIKDAGPYQLDLRYASGESRSIQISLNGQVVLDNAASKVTGGFQPQHQQWHAEGILNFKQGINTISFERESYFPHIDKFLLTPRPGEAETKRLTTDLKIDIVKDIAERIKNKIDVRIELPEKRDHLFPAPIAQDLMSLESKIAGLEKNKPKLDFAMAVEDGKPTDLPVHLRGSYLTLGDNCPRRFPTVLTDPKEPLIPKDRSGRAELAHWLTDSKNPLTARVFVNRIWRWKFGRGIVSSVDNFGALGEFPTHPELLDYLATTFVSEDKWSLKKLQKRLMLTNTYMMSGRYDPKMADIDTDNRYLWRFPRQRLEAEEIRDSIFFVSGMLDRTMGGTLIKLSPRAYVTNDQSANPINYDSPRRAVYLPVIRAAVYDVYTAFDFGDPTVMNGDRSSTTIAPQALFMLNGKAVLSATKTLATKILKRSDLDDKGRVKYLYETCFGRPATDAELNRSITYLAKFEEIYAKSKEPKLSAWQSLCRTFIGANEFIYVE